MVEQISVYPSKSVEIKLGQITSSLRWLDFRDKGQTITTWFDDLKFLEKLYFEVGVYLAEAVQQGCEPDLEDLEG